MKQCLKENFVLITGVALPIVLALVFFISTKVSMIGVEPPKTAVIYATGIDGYYRQDVWEAKVTDGKLTIEYSPAKDDGYWNSPTIYYFNPTNSEVKSYKVPSIEKAERDKKAVFPVDSFGDIKILDEEKSPDGYVFTQQSRNSGGLISDMFGGYRNSRYVLKKGGYQVAVPETQGSYDIKFIGWVTP